MKILRRLLLLAVIPLAIVLIAYLLRDRFIAGVIEAAGTKALGVETEVANVSTSLTDGRFAVMGLRAANPPGFSAEPVLSIGTLSTELPLSRLPDDPLVVEEVVVDGVSLRVERRGATLNLQPIKASLDRLKGAEPAPTAESQGADEPRKIVIRRVRIAATELVLDLGQPWVQPRSVTLDEVVLTDIEATGDDALAKVLGLVVERLLDAALGAAGELPAEFGPVLDALRAGLEDGLQAEDLQAALDVAMVELKSAGQEALSDALEEGKAELGAQAAELLGQQGAELLEGLQGVDGLDEEAKKQLGGLLGGLKKPGGN